MVEILDVASMLVPQFEPKRKYRWVLAMEGIDMFLLKSCARPSYTSEETVHHWINGTRYLHSKYTFEDISVVLNDPIAPSGAQQVMEWIRLAHEHVSQRGGYADFYKRNVQLKMLDPYGAVVELWDGRGVFIKAANYGELAYETMDMADITLTLRSDLWVLQY